MRITRTRGRCRLDFVIPERIVELMILHGIDPGSVVGTNREWFDITLPELTENMKNSGPRYRREYHYQVSVYSLVTGWRNGKAEETVVPIKSTAKRILADGLRPVGKCFVRFRILIK